MGARLLELGVALAAVLSAGLIGMLLAAPLQPQPSPSMPPASATARPAAAAEPVGLYLAREAIGAGPCVAVELSERSYPADAESTGAATVLLWTRGVTGCNSRSGEIEEVDATVRRVPSEDPAGPAGYSIEFRIPGGTEGPALDAEIAILPSRQPDPVLLQALDVTNPGFGMVLDRVGSVDPPLDPLSTPVPVAGGPTGVFLLRGPFTAEGACLALELTSDSYPTDTAASGPATIHWWEAAGQDVNDPALCYSRIGEMHEADATVMAITDGGDPSAVPTHYVVRFSAPLPGADAQGIEFSIVAETSNRDQLRAVGVVPERPAPLVFDRVDELNPPLTPSPSASVSP